MYSCTQRYRCDNGGLEIIKVMNGLILMVKNLGENEPKEANNATEQKTKRTRVTTKTAKDSSQK